MLGGLLGGGVDGGVDGGGVLGGLLGGGLLGGLDGGSAHIQHTARIMTQASYARTHVHKKMRIYGRKI